MNTNHHVVVVTDPVTHQLFYGGMLWPLLVAMFVMAVVGWLSATLLTKYTKRGTDINIPVVVLCIIAAIATLKYMGVV